MSKPCAKRPVTRLCAILFATVSSCFAIVAGCEPTIRVAPTNKGGAGGEPAPSSSSSSGTTIDGGVLLEDAASTDADAADPCFGAGTWAAINTSNAASWPSGMASAWTGSMLLIWGGGQIIIEQGSYDIDDGAMYDAQSNTWSAMSNMHSLQRRWYASGVWTGTHFLVWGGSTAEYGGAFGNGAAYDPMTDAWTAISSSNAPTARNMHSAIWTGDEMIVWGGADGLGSTLGDGSRYDPATDSWEPVNPVGAPAPRTRHTAIWTGKEMIIWGGYGQNQEWGDGAAYDPVTDSWRPLSSQGAPSGRHMHSAVWTGSAMLIWGGESWTGNTLFSDGAIYNLALDSWTSISTTNAPEARAYTPAIWTGTSMIIWGGSVWDSSASDTGGLYEPTSDTWQTISNCNVPHRTARHVAVWTGNEMLVLGGTGYTPLSQFTP